MSNLIGTGFNAGSDDGEFATLENDLRALADIGCDTVEIAATSLDVIAGGRIIDFRYTVHGLVSSNFMDPVTCRYQIDAAKALAVLCDRIGAGILVQHGGALRADQIAERAEADHRERDALFELAEFCRPYGVRIALENIFTTEPGQYRQTPAEVAATVKAVGHDNVVALIDFSHAYLESTYRGLDSAGRRVSTSPIFRRKTQRLASAICICRSAGATLNGRASSPN